jgi:two-component system cell cycle sensor histidine kinase/response regulator CckA
VTLLTTFLPVFVAQSDPARLDLWSVSEHSQTSTRTILVVDDEPDVLQLIQSILGDTYDITVATSADSAIQTFGQMEKRPDLLLTDVVMPGISGPMLVDRLLALEPELRVLFMSGYDDRQVVQRYVVEKGFNLISKPFTVKRLRSAIQAVFDGDGKPRKLEPGS